VNLVRKECEIKESIVTRMKVNKLRWFGHAERMKYDRMTKKIFLSERKGVRKKGCPRITWIDHIDSILKGGNVRSRIFLQSNILNCKS
jgi:hypothetical protein